MYLTITDISSIPIELVDETLSIFQEATRRINNYRELLKLEQENKGCYIATMAYGDYEHPQVRELRKFRDDFLSKTSIGRNFIKIYYKYSPSLVEKLKNKQRINLIIRKGLDQFIKTIKK
jgi:predicted amino acid dehydrogenase